jgi:two-component system, cell cycle sensor histidine kinase and response regulator CckA
VISDVIMAGMSGPDLARRLSSVRSETKVLYISGYTRNALAPGAAVQHEAFLAKPFSPRALTSKIREVLTTRGTG